MATETRLLTLDDAPALVELLRVNRAFLAPWEPLATEEYYTLAGQRAVIEGILRAHAAGAALPFAILADGELVGRITLSNIVRGPFQSGNVGYWCAEAHNGRGHTTAALAHVCEVAFSELGMHRIEAGTLTDNVRSQAVLARNGFQRFGLAPRYLNIAGRWQDHVLFQRLSDD